MFVINASTVVSIIFMGGLGLLFSSILAIADKKLAVTIDPRIEQISSLLPGINCGACGFASCWDYAENLVCNNLPSNLCKVADESVTSEISQIVGKSNYNSQIKLRPVVLCSGTKGMVKKKSVRYLGSTSCVVQNLISGGSIECIYGCLGGGDCVNVCPFNAVFMNENGLPEIIQDHCTGCGLCAKVCPRNLIEMHPITDTLFVFCKNPDDPRSVKKVCDAGCIGCGICARKSNGSIVMNGFLPKIDYSQIDSTFMSLDKCPTNVIREIK
jgi:electron transport complex protein RnfB